MQPRMLPWRQPFLMSAFVHFTKIVVSVIMLVIQIFMILIVLVVLIAIAIVVIWLAIAVAVIRLSVAGTDRYRPAALR